METYRLSDDREALIALYEHVTNAAQLRQLAISGVLPATLIKASLVAHKLQLLVAANKAVRHERQGKMITKNINSEILYCLSPERSITEAFRTFGISDTDSRLVVLQVINITNHESNSADTQRVFDKIQGDLVPLSCLNPSDIEQQTFRKIYKISDEELSLSATVQEALGYAAVNRIAGKDVLKITDRQVTDTKS